MSRQYFSLIGRGNQFHPIEKTGRRSLVCRRLLDIIYDKDIDWTRLGFQLEAELFFESLHKCWSCWVGLEVSGRGRGGVEPRHKLKCEIEHSSEAGLIQYGAADAVRSARQRTRDQVHGHISSTSTHATRCAWSHPNNAAAGGRKSHVECLWWRRGSRARNAKCRRAW